MDLHDVRSAFARIGAALSPSQQVRDVSPNTSVGDALAIMDAQGYSQLPVTAGDVVLGVFSYRSLARGVVRTDVKAPIGGYAVEEFVEPVRYVRPDQDFSEALDDLDADAVVLVGDPADVAGLLTPMDLLRFVDGLARPFVLLREIELTLRQIVERCIPENELAGCVTEVLTSAYESRPGGPPTEVMELTVADYVSVVRDGRAWKYFEGHLGGDRHRVAARLKPLPDLRNDALHFRRDLDEEDLVALLDIRDWLLMRLQVMRESLSEAREDAT